MKPSQVTQTDPNAEGENLADEIRATVPREPGDIVRCTRVGHRYYRCNWWQTATGDVLSNPSANGLQLGTTSRVRKSAYLEVTRAATGLTFRESAPRVG